MFYQCKRFAKCFITQKHPYHQNDISQRNEFLSFPFFCSDEMKTEQKTHHFVLLEYTKCSAYSLKFMHVNRNTEQWKNIVVYLTAQKRKALDMDTVDCRHGQNGFLMIAFLESIVFVRILCVRISRESRYNVIDTQCFVDLS